MPWEKESDRMKWNLKLSSGSLRHCFAWKQQVIEQKAYPIIWVESYETGWYNSLYKYRLTMHGKGLEPGKFITPQQLLWDWEWWSRDQEVKVKISVFRFAKKAMFIHWMNTHEWLELRAARSSVKETNKAENRHERSSSQWAEALGWNSVKLFITPLLCPLERSLGHAWGVLNGESFKLRLLPTVINWI